MVTRTRMRSSAKADSGEALYRQDYGRERFTKRDSPEHFVLVAQKEWGIGQIVDLLSRKYCEVRRIEWSSHFITPHQIDEIIGSGTVYKRYSFDKLFLMTEKSVVDQEILKVFAENVRASKYDISKVIFLIAPDLGQQLGFEGVWKLQEAEVKYHMLSKDLLAIASVSYGSIFVSHLFYPEASTTLDHLIVSRYLQKQMSKEIEEIIYLLQDAEERAEYARILKEHGLSFVALSELIRNFGIKDETFRFVSGVADLVCNPAVMKEIQATSSSSLV